MGTYKERGGRANCFVPLFSSKECLVCTRVAYSVPEVRELVAQRPKMVLSPLILIRSSHPMYQQAAGKYRTGTQEPGSWSFRFFFEVVIAGLKSER
jgi:hypothetical protein